MRYLVSYHYSHKRLNIEETKDAKSKQYRDRSRAVQIKIKVSGIIRGVMNLIAIIK